MSALSLSRLHWGRPSAEKNALMVHGLGSAAATCWRVMETLADQGWSSTAVDLRGHGSSPRASTYAIADFATDLEATTPEGTNTWDLVIGHSIGAAAAVVASSRKPRWARRLVLIDPALSLDDSIRMQILENQRLGHLHQSVDDMRGLNPAWHPLDWELKIQANRAASLFALEHAVYDNDPWDVTDWAKSVSVPTHVLGAERGLGSMFCGDYAEAMLETTENFSYEVIPGAGHSVHRDKPAETLAALRAFLAS